MTKKDIQAFAKIVDLKIKTALAGFSREVDQKFVKFGELVDKKFVRFGEDIDKKITRGLGDFFVDVMVPYLEKHVEKRFDDIEDRLNKHGLLSKNLRS